jgi:alpha-glucuronidase
VPYTYRLHSGKTVIQHIYDSHYQGTERAQQLVQQWKTLQGHIDEQRYAATLRRLQYQAGHAIVWRDAVCNWFQNMSGIPDALGRVGNYPDRIEAESMRLRGYRTTRVTPPETASGGKAVKCRSSSKSCTATFTFERNAGRYDISVQYFDQNTGASQFKFLVAGHVVDEWVADDHLPARTFNGSSSTRRWIEGVELHPGDSIEIEGHPDGKEPAGFDYVEIHPAAGAGPASHR